MHPQEDTRLTSRRLQRDARNFLKRPEGDIEGGPSMKMRLSGQAEVLICLEAAFDTQVPSEVAPAVSDKCQKARLMAAGRRRELDSAVAAKRDRPASNSITDVGQVEMLPGSSLGSARNRYGTSSEVGRGMAGTLTVSDLYSPGLLSAGRKAYGVAKR